MKKIPFKNYIILIILLICTIILTLLLLHIYLKENKQVSDFYKYCNKITDEDLGAFVLENSDSMLYIFSKYNLEYKGFEKKFQDNIDDLNIKDKLVYIDVDNVSNSFYTNLNNKYKKDIDFDSIPILIIFNDEKIDEIIYINKSTDASSFIDYEVFK